MRRTRLARPAVATLLLALGAAAGGSGAAQADAPERDVSSFAIVIGSNTAVDPELKPLKFADDDAVRYASLFRLFGARTYLITRLDDNTRRLHPEAVADAAEPRIASLTRALAQVTRDITAAKARHEDTQLYFVFAGHGSVQNGQGYIALEDQRLTGTDLATMLRDVPAAHVHVIVDACASYYLAYRRGPGGTRHAAGTPISAPQLADDARIGLLLSTSSARESHEWDGFQAGVFSHELRSGLYGGADADGDGRITYRELAAFVSRANAAIPNERFRPDVHARAPSDSETLFDLRRGLSRRIDVDAAHAGHYWVENAIGERLIDVHDKDGVRLVRPGDGTLYIRRAGDDAEFTVPVRPDIVSLSDLRPAAARVASRGAAGEAMNMLFSLPFDSTDVRTYVNPPEPPLPLPPRTPVTRPLGWTAIAVGAAGAATAGVFTALAVSTRANAPSNEPEAETASRNARIKTDDTVQLAGYIGGGALVGAGVLLLVWPDSPPVEFAASAHGGTIGYGGRF